MGFPVLSLVIWRPGQQYEHGKGNQAHKSESVSWPSQLQGDCTNMRTGDIIFKLSDQLGIFFFLTQDLARDLSSWWDCVLIYGKITNYGIAKILNVIFKIPLKFKTDHPLFQNQSINMLDLLILLFTCSHWALLYPGLLSACEAWFLQEKAGHKAHSGNRKMRMYQERVMFQGSFLAAQWLRCCAFAAGGVSSP